MAETEDAYESESGESPAEAISSEGGPIPTSDGGYRQDGSIPDLLNLDEEVKASIRILVIDDDRTLSQSCGNVLRQEGFQVEVCERGDEARAVLQREPFDIVLIDLYMSEVSGMDLLKVCLAKNPDSVAIVMTGNPSVESSIKALRAGAWDYLAKPFAATHLQVLIGRAAHAVTVTRETREVQAELEKRHGHSEKVTLLGASAQFEQIIQLARKVARTDASVFITGESGTGKELIAQFIHHHSRRSSRQLVPVNCAALPESLLESEMFGHVEGAFTGAVKEKPGLLEEANGGTLFLDELTSMPQPIQAKLLRAVQDGVVRRVGSTKTDAVVNVRFIAATNQDPTEAVEAGNLRHDLYYRLRVVPIHVPPLRERPDDIPVLSQHFLQYFWRRYRQRGEAQPTFSDEAMQALLNCPWRGNARELRNVIEHTVVLVEPGTTIRPEDIPFMDRTPGAGEDGHVVTSPSLIQGEYHQARDRLLADFEKRYLAHVVREANGNMSDAARMAAVDRTTLYRLMQKHDLDRDDLLPASDD